MTFGFILGVQRRTFRDQDPVNIHASELVGRLHDALFESGCRGHDLERFLVRIVFCLFADDTGIFEPLFLDDLRAEFVRLKSRKDSRRITELQRFQKKLGEMRFFDPACGCGNFLIIAYRELRALEIDWEELLSARQCAFVFGNPPFVGAKFQTQEQREQTRRIASLGKSGGTLDYVTAWFIKAGEYVKTGAARIGFVSTNSITQGEQVGQLWPVLFDRCKLEIAFAHRTFAWGRTRGVRRTSISSLSAWTGGNKHGRINGSSVTRTLTVNRKKSAMP